MRTAFHARLKPELDQATAYYRQHGSPELALRFLSEFERLLGLALRQPDLGRPLSRGRRRLLLRGFPYQLIYRVRDAQLEVLVLRHEKQSPGYGERR